MWTILDDFRFALRSFLARPGWVAVAALTLALGLGATTAILSVVEPVLLAPLPYPSAHRLVMLRETTSGVGTRLPLSPSELEHLRRSSSTVDAIEAADLLELHLVDELDGGDGAHRSAPERIEGAMVSTGFFRLLGVEPALGRSFSDDDIPRPGEDSVVLLSHGLWKRVFGGDPTVVGRRLRMLWNASFGPDRPLGQIYTVIGVLPRDLHSFLGEKEMWVPLVTGDDEPSRTAHYLFPYARLADGIDLDQARTELSFLLASLPRQGIDAEHHDSEVSINMMRLGEVGVDSVRPALLLLSGAALVLLLIACTNVANLLLAWGSARQGEIALRRALGASGWGLIRAGLVEGAMLTLLGGGAGLLLAWIGVAVADRDVRSLLPAGVTVELDPAVLGLSAATAAGATLLFTLLPALRLSRTPALVALGRSPGGDSTSGGRLRSILVVAQVGLAVVLLVAAGLLLRSVHRLAVFDPGFATEDVLTARLSLPPASYHDNQERLAFYDRLYQRLAAIPGVERASLASVLPLTPLNTVMPFQIVGRPAAQGEVRSANLRQVGFDYFATLGIPLVEGRGFESIEVETGPKVAVVNRIFVDRFFGGDSPLGARLVVFGDELEIVGVVAAVHQHGAEREPQPNLYIPRTVNRTMYVVLRSRQRPESVTPLLMTSVHAVDPQLPVFDVQTMTERSANWISRSRFQSSLLALFATVALLLAGIGVYGVLNQSVVRRTREIGIRLALGAEPKQVASAVVRQSLLLVCLGLACGLAGAVLVGRLLQSLLFEVTATDSTILVSVPAILLLAGVFAALEPSWRALRIDPQKALRHD